MHITRVYFITVVLIRNFCQPFRSPTIASSRIALSPVTGGACALKVPFRASSCGLLSREGFRQCVKVSIMSHRYVMLILPRLCWLNHRPISSDLLTCL